MVIFIGKIKRLTGTVGNENFFMKQLIIYCYLQAHLSMPDLNAWKRCITLLVVFRAYFESAFLLNIYVLVSRDTHRMVRVLTVLKGGKYPTTHFVIFKPLSYCFEKTIGFDVKASFASRPVSRLIRWYNKPDNITK